MKLALVVGHTAKAPGACNDTFKTCEFAWNSHLATLMEACPFWEERGIEVIRLWRPANNSISRLVSDINASGADVYVELHANAYNKSATGTETLYWYASGKGKELAQRIQAATVSTLGLADRGIKPISSGDRGAQQLGQTKPVAILTEPFFIDNDDDLARANVMKEYLANRVSAAISSWMKPCG